MIGTIGYELDRYVVSAVGFDYGYTYRLFIYAGFMGLIMGLLLRTREKQPEKSTDRHLRYTGTLYSGGMAVIGCVFLWVFFPMIVMDPPAEYSKISVHAIYTAPICILYGLAGSTMLAIAFSYFLNKKLMIRDITHGSIAGAIAVASAGYFITNPVWAMLVGSVAGIIQAFINYFEKKHSLNNKIVTTVSFGFFGIQGLVGAAWSAIWRAVIIRRTDNLVFNLDGLKYPALEFASGCIAMGIGIGFGLIAGLFVLVMAKHERADHFDDYVYWEKDDGLRYPVALIAPPILPVTPFPDVVPGVKEVVSNIKQRYAYL